jgi:tetratricopeptide (TPR) repeat protein
MRRKASKSARVVTSAERLERLRGEARANPQDAEAALRVGWAMYAAGEHAEAEEWFALTATLAPADVEGVYGLGMTRRARGKTQAAIEAFEKAVRLAERISDRTRGQLIQRLAKGHVNYLRSGDWNLEREVWRR